MIEETFEAIRDEKLKHLAIINYILNKNSHTLPKGIDYKKAYEDMEEYEQYLAKMI